MAPDLFRNQNYKKLKKQLIKEKKLFTDLEFPPSNASLYYDPLKSEGVEWKRPGDIVQNPRLFVEGVSFTDVTQGVLGDCWFVSACSTLTRHKQLWSKVIPNAKEQEWDESKPERYCGIFHFCFWRFGRWTDVVVDDLLPTRNGQLIYARSKTQNEFWCALLEKAFAKLHSCYEAMVGGTLAEAFVEITGGVPITVQLDSELYRLHSTARMELFNTLREAFSNKALMAASIDVQKREEIETPLECGLMKGHSYAVTAITKLNLDNRYQNLFSSLFSTPEKIMMVRFQNPWGKKEWKGPWSDGSAEWDQISKSQQRELDLKIEENGEFWMNWEDVCKYFTTLHICYQFNTSFFSLNIRYQEVLLHGMWHCGKTRGDLLDRAGGCSNFKETCFCNPQYRLDVYEDGAQILASLLQRSIRERRREGAKYLTIGMMLFKVENNRVYRLHYVPTLIATSDYTASQSVFFRVRNLRRGRYVIIPSTFTPGEEGEFMLRIYTLWNSRVTELTQDLPSSFFPCLKKSYTCVTQLCISGAVGLDASKGLVNPYCIVNCDGSTIRTTVCKDCADPVWDMKCVFVRKRADKPVKIDVWSANLVKDTFIGRVLLDCPVTNSVTKLEKQLQDKRKRTEEPEYRLGKLLVQVATYDNPMHF